MPLWHSQSRAHIILRPESPQTLTNLKSKQQSCAPLAGSGVKHWMDAWAHQPGFPLITLRIAGQDGQAADDDSADDDDDRGSSSTAPLRLTAQQVSGSCKQRLLSHLLVCLLVRWQQQCVRCSCRRRLHLDSSWRAAAPATAARGARGGCRWPTSQGAQAATRSAPPAGWSWTTARQVPASQHTANIRFDSVPQGLGIVVITCTVRLRL